MNDAVTIAMETPPAQKARDAAVQWLGRFETALTVGNATGIAALFAEESHYRDMLAFSWTIRPCLGAEAIAGVLATAQKSAGAHGFALAEGRTPPRVVRRLGIEVHEEIFRFETETGRCFGVLRLPTATPDRAWVLMTSLDELKGHEERIGPRRPSGDAYSRNFGGLNWLDQRDKARAFGGRDPEVLVVGGGQNGLAVAACLGQLDIDTLVVDKYPRIGDNWRVRYHSLALHNQIQVNHLPYMPFPPTWPKYIPKDMLGNWLEMYAEAMELNCWSNTEFAGGTYDDSSGRWTARLRMADGSERVMHPRHLILSNGTNGIAHMPELPGLKDFAGDMFHSHGFKSGAPWRGKKALVLGTGNSGHDVAQDLHSHGVDTTIIQRGSTTVVSIEPSAKMNYALYEEGPPLEDCDLIGTATTYPLMIRGYQAGVKRMVEADKAMIEGLQSIGYKWDIGEDETGHQMKYRRRCGGYYLDAGCSQLLIDGEIGLLQFERIERFVPEGALLKDGTIRHADLLVLATGYHTQQEMVRRLLGNETAERVGQVWGIDEQGEMANMWKRTPQPGLWFMGGGLTQSRIYSRYVALQIKAIQVGLISAEMPA
jgi:putative flavoprotein involved in K+ transport